MNLVLVRVDTKSGVIAVPASANEANGYDQVVREIVNSERYTLLAVMC